MVQSPIKSLLWVALLATVAAGAARGEEAAPNLSEDPIKITVNLPKASYVTLVIEDLQGDRIRNLIGEQKLEAGKNVISWDGVTDSGGLARPGAYRWRGLYRDQLDLEYQFSAYTAGANPPWFNTAVQKGTDSGWLSDHNPTWSVCAAGDEMFLGSITSEAGQDLMAVDLDGKKKWGISHPYGVGAKEYAYDGQFVYAGGEGQWGGANGYVFRIDPKTYATEKIWDHKGYLGLRGMAAKDGKLYLSSEAPGAPAKILVLDLATRQIVNEIPLPDPGGLAFTPDGKLLAISGQTVVIVDDAGHLAPLINDHLTRPNRIAVGPDGVIYITDGPTSWYHAGGDEQDALYGTEDVRFKGDNQVKVFDARGQFLRAIGTPGGRKPGPFDPQAMRCPVGIAVDGKGLVWVCEWDMLPKRISVWNGQSGKLVREFIGAHKYGGGGALDPGDRSIMIYDGMLFKLDWDKGSWRLTDTIVDIMNVRAEEQHTFGGYANWPSRIVRYQGQQYFVSGNDDIGGTGGGTIWKRKGDTFVPVSHVAPFRPGPIQNGQPNKNNYLYQRMTEVLGDKAPGGAATDIGGPPGQWNQFTSYLMLWSDQNGDGIVQPSEVTFSDKPFYWLANPYIGPDLSIYLSNPAHRGVTNIWRLPVARMDAGGVPIYDITKLQVVREDLPNSVAASSMEADSTGRVYVNASSIYGINPKDGSMWTYPNPWPMYGDGAPHPKPGLVIAGYSVRGVADAGGEAGTIMAINSDFGQWYLFTSDGLFLSTLFGDTRTSPFWGTHFKQATRGMLANGVSLGQESFFGSLNKGSDGNIYIVAGHPHVSIIKLKGLDTVKRFQGTLNVDAPTVLELGKEEEQKAIASRQENPAPSKVLPTYAAIVASAFHPGHSLDVVAGRFPHSGVNYAYYIGYDDDNIYVRANMPHFANQASDIQHLFATGDAVILELGLDPTADPKRTQPAPGDVRIVIARFKGQPVAVLYRYRVAGVTTPTVFQSAGGKVTIDQISKIAGAEVTVEPFQNTSGKTLAVTAKIPWKALTDTPARFGPVVELRGDAGFVIGNPQGTAAQRINWANQATGVVGDLASQARLMPNLWGVFNPKPKTDANPPTP